MIDQMAIPCPWCGEINDVDIEIEAFGQMTQDCEVCCRPILLDVRRDEWGDPLVTAERGD